MTAKLNWAPGQQETVELISGGEEWFGLIASVLGLFQAICAARR